jgi:hypothetical protein
MQLELLRSSACLAIYHDLSRDWLLLEWAGELTLAAVQDACIAVVECYMRRTYLRVLISNSQVTGVGEGVASWLGVEFIPYMAVVGVTQIAWISAPTLLGRHLAQTVAKQIPSLTLTLFNTREEATVWLQQPLAAFAESMLFSPWQTPAQVRLAQGVEVLRQEAQLIRQEVQYLHQKVAKRQTKSVQA